jgi:NAD(P)-dependent dehydrogenase (short-subunit alcohol dehydrogenase family)
MRASKESAITAFGRAVAPNWLITGASGGFGVALTKAVLEAGGRVVCVCRRAERLEDLLSIFADRMEIIRVDLEQPEATREAIASGLSWLETLDVLVNNAGMNTVQAFEEMPEAEFTRIVQTNLLGTVAVTRSVVPHMRKRRRGHIVMMSSTGGFIGESGFSAYSAAKFGIEGFSEALARELRPFGIHVVVVEPGPFRTSFRGKSMRTPPLIKDYVETLRAGWDSLEQGDGRQPGDPALAAAAILSTVLLDSPPLRLPLGAQAIASLRRKISSLEQDLATTEALRFVTEP